MKILQLRFKNLNSLYGEWEIDFTNPVYQQEGIFAIIGPTGAGKSTILDAICLGLYGRTPRLSKVNKNSNEIMSRHSGECYSEVTFSTAKGTYRVFWSQHRARKKPSAGLVDYKHELTDASNDTLIETKRSLTYKVIEEKTGMDFERFTKSILLAQGSFDTFLKADSDERSPILEKITGTSIYSDISKKVHERKSEEQKKVELLEIELGSINLFSEEQETTEIKKLFEKEKQETEQIKEHQLVLGKINWLEKMSSLENELIQLNTESELLKNDVKEFEPDKRKLQQAQKAIQLEPAYMTLSEKRKQLKATTEQQIEKKELLPLKEKQLRDQKVQLQHSEESLKRKQEEQKKTAPLLNKVRGIDLLINEKSVQQATEQKNINQYKLELKVTQTQILELEKTIQQQYQLVEILKKYLCDNNCDKVLISEFGTISYKLDQLKQITEQGWEIRNQKNDTEKDIKTQQTQLTVLEQTVQTEKKSIEITQQQLTTKSEAYTTLLNDKLKREYQTELENLQKEIMYLRKISDLESERTRLVEGKPCPLCGSEKHPFSRGNVPQANEKEVRLQTVKTLLNKVENVEKEIESFKQAENKQLLQLGNIESQRNECKITLDGLVEATKRLQKDLNIKKEEFETIQEGVTSFLTPLNITFSAKDLAQLVATLQTRQQTFLAKQNECEGHENQLTDLKAQLNTQQTLLKTRQQQLSIQKDNFEAFNKKFATLQKERSALFGEKNVDEFESQLEQRAQHLNKMFKENQLSCTQADKETSELQTLIKKVEKDILEISAITEKENQNFLNACLKIGFTGEQHFLESILLPETLTQFEDKEKSLVEKEAGLNARRKDRKEKLIDERNRKLTEKSVEELQKAQTTSQEQLKELGEQIGAIKQQLEDNKTAKERLSLKLVAIKAQKKEFSKWQKLHRLIGSSDGKKYRNFAQGLTFEIMVQHANHQLEKMSDRYLLVRDNHNPLELNVIDNYQAGEERSTKNLSGGESFIISLALALGLSNMASRQIRVDSLFLDEGFGTLDEEALETALTTLSSLHQDDKLIGVISHVPALQERIVTQIQIHPAAGGKSTILGTGVKRTS